MYCKYCGKPLSDGARFCGFCGKDQTEKIVDNSTVTSSVTVDKQFIPEFEVPNAKFFSIIALAMQIGIIALSFTPLLTLSLGNDDIGYSQSFTVFDLFKKSDILEHVGYLLQSEYSRNAIDSINGVAIFIGILICALIAWCVIYFLYNLSTYTFRSGQSTKVHFGYVYSVYSSASCIALSIGIIIFNIVFSSWFGHYVDVSISPTSIIIFILSVGQFVLNRIYLSE